MAISQGTAVFATTASGSTLTPDFSGAVGDDEWVFVWCAADSGDNSGVWTAESGWKFSRCMQFNSTSAVFWQKASSFGNPTFDFSGTADDLACVGVPFDGVHLTVPFLGGIATQSPYFAEATPTPVDVLYSMFDGSLMVAAACYDDNDFDTNYEISGWTKVGIEQTNAASVAVCSKSVGSAPSAETVGAFAALASSATESGTCYTMVLIPDTASAGGGPAWHLRTA